MTSRFRKAIRQALRMQPAPNAWIAESPMFFFELRKGEKKKNKKKAKKKI
jgi:hypothetical protein